MASNDTFLVSGATGIASVAPLGTTAPTSVSAALSTPWTDLGGISDDGLTEAYSESWQNYKKWGAIEPSKSTLTAATRTFQLTFWEGNATVLGLYYRLGTAPTPASGVVDFAEPTTVVPDYRAFCFDIIEGTNHIRLYVPKAQVTDRGNIVYNQSNIAGYQVTLTTYGGGHRFYDLDGFPQS